jgi:hypothetical protein
MALAAYLYLELLPGGTGCKRVAAGAYHLGIFIIFGMYLLFHYLYPA